MKNFFKLYFECFILYFINLVTQTAGLFIISVVIAIFSLISSIICWFTVLIIFEITMGFRLLWLQSFLLFFVLMILFDLLVPIRIRVSKGLKIMNKFKIAPKEMAIAILNFELLSLGDYKEWTNISDFKKWYSFGAKINKMARHKFTEK